MPDNDAIKAAMNAVKSEVVTTQNNATTDRTLALPENLDWSKWSLPATAALLQRIPGRDRLGNPKYMTPEQAAIFAIVCFEYGVSPFTGDAYFMEETNRVNLTLQGKLKVARNRGAGIGAPQFKNVDRDWLNPKQAIAGYAKDFGVECTLPIKGQDRPVVYTAWISEWYMPKNPNWVTRTTHMASTRAYEKALSWAAGVGESENPDDRDIEVGSAELPQLPAGEMEYVASKLVK